jgi:soluble lytic murein transglycosylase-like protein
MNATIQTQVTAAATRNGIPPAIALAVVQQESGGNPNAISSAGAAGLMQLMPATAASLGVTNPLDPTQSANGGTAYLAQLYNQFGNWPQAIAAYDAGPGAVSSAIAAGGSNWLSLLPAETQAYVPSVLAGAGMSYDQVDQSLAPADVSYDDSGDLDLSAASAIDPTTILILTAAGFGALLLADFFG